MAMDSNDEKQAYRYAQPTNNRSAYAPFIYALVLAFGVMLGFVVNNITIGKQGIINRQYNKLDDIMNYVQLKYVDTVNREDLVDNTIDKVLSNLDPHSVYIPARELGEMNESLEGNFEGIGIEFFIVQDTITVVTAIPGGPSEMAGLKAGDRIVKINDTTVAGIKISENDVKHRLRGPKGTRVKVGIMRSGRAQLLDVEIQRDKIPLYSVDAAYMLNSETGYIKINNFSSTTHKEFIEKMRLLEKDGMKKLVIDLRGNPGGYLQAATSIADEMLGGDQLIVYTMGKAYERQDYNASKPGLFERGDVKILIDQGSASASEILAGAIQDCDRGTVIGRTSFGKGLVQEQYELRDGSALRLTVARYYTPSGRCIQRSYENGSEDYYNQIYERYLRGEFVHEDTIKSKDTTVYTTRMGRRVYGGGGIHPDVFVPIDTVVESEYYFAVRSFVPEFVYKYTSVNPGLLDSYSTVQQFRNGFKVSPALMDEFYAYAKTAGFKNYDAAKAEKVRARLQLTLSAFIAKQKWRTEGYYYLMNEDDKVIKTALTYTPAK